MIIDVDLYGKIREMYTVENMSQRAIARELGISRNTVKKYCAGNQVPWDRKEYYHTNEVLNEEITAFIQACLEDDDNENIKKQKHTARRIYHRLVDEKGFTGGESTVRRYVSLLKVKAPSPAVVPLSFDPGEAIQVDWGEATIYLNNVKTKVNLFCARLCYSLDIFVMAFHRQNEESFLEGHVAAFNYINGVPHKVFFDNAKVAVKEGFGQYAKPQAKYQAFSSHYAFKMRFCNPGKGNEKGLVENLVGWARRNILVPIPRVKSLDELNCLLLEKCLNYRKHQVRGRDNTVGHQYETEKFFLHPLPAYVFDTSKSIHASVNEYSTVRFERNNYSVPVKYTGKTVSVKGFGNQIKVFYQGEEIAQWVRQYGRDQTAYCLEHYLDLLELKPRAVFNARPVKNLIQQELLEWGEDFPNGAKDMVRLLRYCIDYGTDKILSIKRSLPAGVTPSIDLVRCALIPKTNPVSISTREITVQPVDLSLYDQKYGVAQ